MAGELVVVIVFAFTKLLSVLLSIQTVPWFMVLPKL